MEGEKGVESREKDAMEEEDEEEELTFESMGLDPRLLRALSKKGLEKPTPVQSKCIPLALGGKDIVARARTGSGKTLAYLLPLLQHVLTAGASGGKPSGIVLVPTRELCQQVRDEVASLAEFCGGAVSVSQLASGMSSPAMRAALQAAPDVVVATPGRISACLREGIMTAGAIEQALSMLVLDEADVLLSYGYEDDLKSLAALVPRRTQCLLMSATSSPDVDRLKKLVLHSPVTLTLHAVEGSATGGGLSATVKQHVIRCPPADKLLHVLALLRLQVVHKKALIFVGSIDTGFRVRLFLEQFGVRCAVLNAELPLNSRLHILQEFNRGLFDYLIATDEGALNTASAAAAGRGGGGQGQQPGAGEGEGEGQVGAGEGAGEKRAEDGGEAGEGEGEGEEDEEEENGDVEGGKQAGERKRKRKEAGADDDNEESEEESEEEQEEEREKEGGGESEGEAEAAVDPKKARRERRKQKQKLRRGGGAKGGGGAAGAAAGGLFEGAGEFGVVRGIDFKDVRTVINYDMPPTPTAYVHRVGRTGRAGSAGAAISLVAPAEEPLLAAVEKALAGDGGSGEAAPPAATLRPVIGPFPTLTKNAVENLRYRAEDVAKSVTRVAIREARAKELRLEMLNSERLKAHFEDNPTDLELLKHDKALSKHAPAPHLKAIPAYLRDQTAEEASRGIKRARAVIDTSRRFAQQRIRKKQAGAGGGGMDPLKTFAFKARGKKDEEVPAVAAALAGTLWARKKEKEKRGKSSAKSSSGGDGPPRENKGKFQSARKHHRRKR